MTSMGIREAIRHVLAKANEPLSQAQIVLGLQSAPLKTKATDMRHLVNGNLHAMKKLNQTIRLDDGRWTLPS